MTFILKFLQDLINKLLKNSIQTVCNKLAEI